MNNLGVVALLILLIFLFYPSQCGYNEVYTNCGTACPLTCEKPNIGPCTLQCVIGCQCKKGYLRNKFGKCVSPDKC